MENGEYSCVTPAVLECLCGGDTVWLEGRGGTVPREVMGEETKAMTSHPINPDLECDRCIGYLDRCMCFLRCKKCSRADYVGPRMPRTLTFITQIMKTTAGV